MDSMQPTTLELDRQFRTMIRKFIVERDKIVVKQTLTLPQLNVLSMLDREGPLKAGTLSDELHFSPGAMTALCDKLVKDGYVSRQRPHNDRRIMLLSITARGKQLLQEVVPMQKEHMRLLFQGFSDEDVRCLLQLSSRVFQNLHGYSEAMKRRIEETLEPPGITDGETAAQSS
ncbi:MarR family transcriptional regulator [Paenibacillus sp. H1-7]|uniref:MarR family winged helix-turn-helix transcriptional regulator n=1 Tax=Paenibacillus sp. H1-7 TaxID=2282849 RepID=UPI001EF7EF9F|nr:MarR family transcriptional regulator [Paenibacillus sp. H1-7]